MMKNIDSDKFLDDLCPRIFQEVPFGVHVYKLEDANDEESFVLIGANKYSKNLMGLKSEAILNKRINEVIPDRWMKKTIPIFHKVLRTGKVQIVENLAYEEKCVSGQAWNVKVFPLSQNSVGVAFEIITDHVKAQEKLEFQARLIENISDAVMSSDMDFMTQSWNKGAEKLYGWKSEEAIGKSGLELLRPQKSAEDYLKAKDDMLKNGYWRGEMVQKHKDGHDLIISISSSLVRNYHGEPIGVVTVNRDVTKQRSLEKKLLESYKYLGLLNRKINILLTLNKGESSKGREELVDFLFETIEKVFGAKASVLYSYDDVKRCFHLLGSRGIEEKYKKEISLLNTNVCKDFDTLIEQKGRVIKKFKDCKSETFKYMEGGFLFLPLISGGILSGALVVSLENIEKISTQELDFFELFAAQLCLILPRIDEARP